MNGRSESRRRAAVVGLALLTGATFLGCHAGPRLFTHRDRAHQEERSTKKELADSGKFINRKRLRPESDYFTDEQPKDERTARGDAKKPGKSGALSSSRRSRLAADQDRSVANQGDSSAKRGGPEFADAARTRTNKSTSKSVTDGQTARRTVRELLDDSPLDERVSTSRVAKAPAAKSATAAKTSVIDEDPFKDAVVSRAPAKRNTAPIDAVKHGVFDELDDVQDEEETEELAEMKQTAARGGTTAAPSASTQITRRAIEAPVQASQKSLPEDLDAANSSTIAATSPKVLQIDRRQPAPQPTVRGLTSVESVELDQKSPESSDRNGRPRSPSLSSNTPGNPGNGVSSDRQQQLKNTIDAWRREMDRTDVTGEDKFVPPPNTAAHASLPVDRPQVRDNDFDAHNSSDRVPAFGTENFHPPQKSQGAVLNGELILETSSLPSRFQRTFNSLSDDQSASRRHNTLGDSQGRQRSNAGASIDIVPAATQTRSTRPSGQVSLQSFAASIDKTYSTPSSNAHFEQFDRQATPLNSQSPLPPRGSNVAGMAISETLSSSGGTGPKLMPFDDDVQSVQPPSTNTSSVPKIDWGLEESNSLSARGWKGMLLVIGCLASAILVGLGLRRRQQLAPVRASQPSSHSRAHQSDNPTT